MMLVIALMGVSVAPINPILMSIRQERVPIRYRARVFGTLTAIAFVAIPLGQLVGGYLIEWWGVQPYIFVVSAIYLLVTISFFFNPVLHEMDEKPAPDPEVVMKRATLPGISATSSPGWVTMGRACTRTRAGFFLPWIRETTACPRQTNPHQSNRPPGPPRRSSGTPGPAPLPP
ncbi:MAG TPA: MFS transporter [Thermomicrobiales bacterium]|nr:MFS transporter [Thermomicrobiales bacterium]